MTLKKVMTLAASKVETTFGGVEKDFRGRFLGVYGKVTEEGNNMRPIAVVSTTMQDGRPNTASYSWFSVVEIDGDFFVVMNPVSTGTSEQINHKDTPRALSQPGSKGVLNFPTPQMMAALEVMEGSKGDETVKAGLTNVHLEDETRALKESPFALTFEVINTQECPHPFGPDTIVGKITTAHAQVDPDSLIPMLCRSGGPRWFVDSPEVGMPEFAGSEFQVVGQIETVARQFEVQQQVQINGGDLQSVSLNAIHPAGEDDGPYAGQPVFWMMGADIPEGEIQLTFPALDPKDPPTIWDCTTVSMSPVNNPVAQFAGKGCMVYLNKITHSGTPHLHQYSRGGEMRSQESAPLVLLGDRQKAEPVGKTFDILSSDMVQAFIKGLPDEVQGDFYLAPESDAQRYREAFCDDLPQVDNDKEIEQALSQETPELQLIALHKLIVSRARKVPEKETARQEMYRILGRAVPG